MMDIAKAEPDLERASESNAGDPNGLRYGIELPSGRVAVFLRERCLEMGALQTFPRQSRWNFADSIHDAGFVSRYFDR
jgi:hypothetical protein